MVFIPVEEIFKFFPKFSKDRVKFLRRYSFVSLFLGAAVVYKSHKPDFNPRHYTPSFFYKNHLNSLKKKGLVDEEKYNKMLNS
ncbi:conserved Plasmodium protein, unknown function [Plasmodium ovale wallikeri]|uniref:Uncharacterized protein n=2 Tax=Plasmodium ovale TaxID=36330 RepID=A0A1C3KSL2_PLAOA|nr:conserved Plasmodium protein, unknown function [Plasmodium ovale wallikeri]SBT35800.1 conserved Plasmodium protein, unknown function [Plasmodium ovale wallikeri]SBT77137.1 conserved Plasmodium protein, unknown function [Plasmodium ovale]SCP04584.1 conserved Plasmodium protein, unknown function [Plasmodium ovale]